VTRRAIGLDRKEIDRINGVVDRYPQFVPDHELQASPAPETLEVTIHHIGL
jgi:hypothetical protein